jgi:hypothetical protein
LQAFLDSKLVKPADVAKNSLSTEENSLGLEILTPVSMKSTIIWDVTSYSPVDDQLLLLLAG